MKIHFDNVPSNQFVIYFQNFIKAEQKLVMSDKFTLSDNMTDHFFRYIITISSSPSHFNIKITHLSQISGIKYRQYNIFLCAALLCYVWYLENILPSQIPFSWSVSSYLEFQLEFPPKRNLAKFNIVLKRGLSDI